MIPDFRFHFETAAGVVAVAAVEVEDGCVAGEGQNRLADQPDVEEGRWQLKEEERSVPSCFWCRPIRAAGRLHRQHSAGPDEGIQPEAFLRC